MLSKILGLVIVAALAVLLTPTEVDAYGGVHYGYTYTVDASRSYTFSGQVGDLPDATHSYRFGLIVHKGMLAGTATSYPAFLVDYWVEGL